MKRSSREKWLVKAEDARQSITLSASKPLSANVRTGADAVKESLADDSQETKVSWSKALRKAAKHAEEMQPGDLMANAQNVKALIGGSAQVHGWQEAGGAGTTVVNIALIGRSLDLEG